MLPHTDLVFVVIFSFLTNFIHLLPQGVARLSPQEVARLKEYNENDKQSIWELSGQYEGDMVLNNDQRNGILDLMKRWENNEIPYELDPRFDDDQIEYITETLKIYDNKTCIKPRPREDKDVDYVYVTADESGCWSSVGRQGGNQTLNLQPNDPGNGCLRAGTIQHEFLHALGFYHQQSSSNRDDYVDIIWANIIPDKAHNFKKYPATLITSYDEAYDYGSVMHYGEYAFSANREKTIIPKDPTARIGQRIGLSATDVSKLNKMYNCT